MRLLGIDYGTKRVGLALSDGLGLLAHPYATLEKTTRDRLFADLLAIIAKEDVGAVVLGLPQSLSGEDTDTTRQVRNFAQSLRRRTAIPVYFQNEAFSSREAESQLWQSGRRGRKLRPVLDRQSAVIILNDYLECTRESRTDVS
ncbi:putative holliday junction resolvase [Desulfonatronum thiosulfatophilum]|uniref:Putative pre-16S rRNA nuclease n=1 Tax=Desulfonatronum thiosulfatophilum TaxID=617002 RepID=A0A1G6BAR7_9BACT|nr:Holliday junction resolvase RuvX [Desulfonatronum thiosulfatophilum]SDB17727.1 putative holliday junction resolvase [Desulfonatronum thiosulfatophilum]